MGLLGEIFSSGDRMKRKLRGLLDDPMGTIALGSQRMSEDVQQMGLLADESGYLPGTNSVLLTPQQKERARKALADKGAEMAMAAATVWHGSPHKFDKFDSSKIGTGEGAQDYGHGLYLAESPGVAQAYANKLTQVDGRAISDQLDSRVRYLNTLKQQAAAGDTNAAKTIPVMEKSIADLKNQGSLYKVDLPDEQIAKMLDWDKPLSDQSAVVQELLNRAGMYDGPARNASGNVLDDITAHISKQNGRITTKLAKDRAAAADALRAAGIPGIRYLDGGSRGAGQGSSNYVVFPGNEGLLSILERNGAPIGK